MLAGGKKARVLIIPHASGQSNAGQGSLEMWRKVGAEQVAILDLIDGLAALEAVRKADLIWMPGGSQSRLMTALEQCFLAHAMGQTPLCGQFLALQAFSPGAAALLSQTPASLAFTGLDSFSLARAIRERFLQGATVGGTSAGAAVMSKIMLTADSRSSKFPTVDIGKGLGLCPEVIIDQHFFSRRRLNDLFLAVANHPEQVGIGIDECTAVIVHGRSFEVIGRSYIVVIDARNATTFGRKKGEVGPLGNVAVHWLRAGNRFDLDQRLVPSEDHRLLTEAKETAPTKAALSTGKGPAVPSQPK